MIKFIATSFVFFLCNLSLNAHCILYETEEDGRAALALGASEKHAQGVGAVVVKRGKDERDIATGTLIDPQTVITCKHAFKAEEEERPTIEIMDGLCPPTEVIFVLNGKQHPISEITPFPGKDLAKITLKKPIPDASLCVRPAAVSVPKLGSLIFKSIPSFQDRHEKRQRIFSIVGFGRSGLYEQELPYIQDLRRRAGYVNLSSRPIEGGFMSSVVNTGSDSELCGLPLVAAVSGDSGCPIFMKNKEGAFPDVWKLVGIGIRGDRRERDGALVSIFDIFGDSREIKAFFKQ